ncbi:MAG: Holliday junction branch migration protein RuvA [Akkermansiaceae bacterium]|nr:Holliday junction branch migration protein RuvA [Akkermansiaceae bacterium]NNM30311.1 Holliday junction branch migration protein RuvA [Akkermansiaceae bacterium]
MIARVRGPVLEALPNRLVVEAGGIGYQVTVPLSTFDKLNPREGSEVKLLTYLHIRETAQVLYGFATAEERDVFLLLIERVSGIGPAIAMAVLSGMPVDRFKGCVVEGDIAALATIKGLGKKTAERIVLELKDKVGVTAAWEARGEKAGAPGRDAELALLALGYKQAEARKVLRKALEESPEAGADELIRLALRAL